MVKIERLRTDFPSAEYCRFTRRRDHSRTHRESPIQQRRPADNAKSGTMITCSKLAALLAVVIVASATHVAAKSDRGHGPNGSHGKAFAEIYDFTNSPDGYFPWAGGLVGDRSGNLYGVTLFGGDNCDPDGCGVVFKLSPADGGGYSETIIHAFSGQSADGCFPEGGVILDSEGNLYGTTAACGTHNRGSVYQLSPRGDGTWAATTLYSFAGYEHQDGATPKSTLLMAAPGLLYGTTSEGGNHLCTENGQLPGCGTVFQLKAGKRGRWKETILYNFAGHQADGAGPIEGVSMDARGNLYGVTIYGGNQCCQGQGTLYQLKPTKSGAWKETVLHIFPTGGGDGSFPMGIPAVDSQGNIFGVTALGGHATGEGTVWKFSRDRNGVWNQQVLYNFAASSDDGALPHAGVTLDGQGNLFGTTENGGGRDCDGFGCGTVYKLNTETNEMSIVFRLDGTGMKSPTGPVFLNSKGRLFGTFVEGGAVNAPGCRALIVPGCGGVFKVRAK